MLYHNVRIVGYYLRFIDAAALACTSALVWRYGASLRGWPHSTTNAIWVFCGAIVLALIAIGGSMSAYHARRTGRLSEELFSLLEISLYATGVACVVTEILRPGELTKAYLALLIANICALLGVRVVMRTFIRSLRSAGRDYQTWLVVGNNARSAKVVNSVLQHAHFGVRIDEIIDLPHKIDRSSPETVMVAQQSVANAPKCTVVADAEAIRPILANRVIDEVVITLPYRSYYDEIRQILTMCCDAGVSVKLPPDAFDAPTHKTEVSEVADMSLVTHFTGPANHAQLAVKRFIDIVGAIAGLILFAPVFIVAAIAIKLTSAGPIFYTQERVGLHGRNFRLVKFRSMKQNSHTRRIELSPMNEAEGLAFKIKRDPRITGVGRILRSFHLDELPQLWNVLIGDMSLVGPRPLVPNEAHGDEWWQRRRLSMPPGITCLWQVIGDHKMPFRQWMQLDLAYIDGWSVWLDLKLIARTLATVVRGDGW